MLRGMDVEEIQALRREGLSLTAISRLTGLDRKTVRRCLRCGENPPRYGPRPKRPSKLDGYAGFIEERLRAGVWNTVVLLRELREQGYEGGYTILKDYLRPNAKRQEKWRCGVSRRVRAVRLSWTGDTWGGRAGRMAKGSRCGDWS